MNEIGVTDDHYAPQTQKALHILKKNLGNLNANVTIAENALN